MTSERRLFASRTNARASTGPRSAAGKARVAGNARRHGLTRSALDDPAFARDIAAFARMIAGAETDAHLLNLADRIAAAQIDVIRVRRARLELLSKVSEIRGRRAALNARSLRALRADEAQARYSGI